jgi:hypothetical protein
VNTSILYAATPSGVFESVDAGSNWALLDSPQAVIGIAINPANPNLMFVTTDGNGIARSEDGGQSWSAINAGLEGVTQFYGIAVAPDGSGHIYAGSAPRGFFVSSDNGDNWKMIGDTRLTTHSSESVISSIDGDSSSAARASGSITTSQGTTYINCGIFLIIPVCSTSSGGGSNGTKSLLVLFVLLFLRYYRGKYSRVQSGDESPENKGFIKVD